MYANNLALAVEFFGDGVPHITALVRADDFLGAEWVPGAFGLPEEDKPVSALHYSFFRNGLRGRIFLHEQ
jgi:hypothetical protein